MTIVTGRTQAQEANSQRLLIRRISQRYERTIAREITRAMNQYANNLTEPLIDITVNQRHQRNMTGILTRLWNESGHAFSERLFDVAKSLGRIKEVKQVVTTPIVDRAVANWITIFGGQKITQVTDTTMQDINAIVAQGVQDGIGERALGRLIRDIAPTKSASRAQTIARTETHGSGQGISLDVAKQSEIPMQKIWLTAIDERTRDGTDSIFDHTAANGQRRPMAQAFDVSGEPMQYPGDPAGSAGNVINCRCVVGYDVV